MKGWLKESRGYVLISTLFFLMLSGLFSHSVIQVSSNHLLQLKQLSAAYEVKAALNMSEAVLRQELEEGSEPLSGNIHTSTGQVRIQRTAQENQFLYQLSLTKENGESYQKEVIWPIAQIEE